MSDVKELLDTLAQVARDGSLVTLECFSEPGRPDDYLIWRCSIGMDPDEIHAPITCDYDTAEAAMREALAEYKERR